MFSSVAKYLVHTIDECFNGNKYARAIDDWFAEYDCPPVKNTPAELAVYALCKPRAYGQDIHAVLNGLHLQFEDSSKCNMRPLRLRKYLHENIFAHVTRITDPEVLDEIIDLYKPIYYANTGKSDQYCEKS